MNKMLTLLVEEASEVIQACTKIERFGADNHHPLHPEGRPTNWDQLIQEIGDFMFIVKLMGIEQYQIDLAMQCKEDKMRRLNLIHPDGTIK